MSDKLFQIELIEIHWLRNTPEEIDLCAHGQVRITLGDEVIVDESDNFIMKDPESFVKVILSPRIKLICFTATPDDGNEYGYERRLLNLKNFKLIRTGEK